MKKIFYIITILALLLISSCGSDLTSAQEVIKLEVLSIKADKPEVHPGDNIISTVLLGKPEGYNEEYHSIWFLCDPKSDGSSGTSFAECMNPKSANLIGTPGIDQENFSTTIPEDTLTKSNLKSKYMYIIYILCKADAEQCTSVMGNNPDGGFDNDLFKLTLKRIRIVSLETEIGNHNPKIESVYINDIPIESDTISVTNKDKFKVKIAETAYEDKRTDPDGNLVDENIATAWKSNNGIFNFYYTNQKREELLEDLDENSFSTPKDETLEYKIYIIATDSRGGIDWKVLNVVPK